MDEQRVEACLMLPTTGVGVEPQLREQHRDALYPEPARLQSLARRGLGLRRDGRIYGARCCPSSISGGAHRARASCWRVARGSWSSRQGRCRGRSPGDPYFDPFWARCEEAGINVVYHIGRTPFSEMYNTAVGAPATSALAPPFADGVRSVVHRTADRRHAHRIDRRQRLRTIPTAEDPERRVRLELGGAVAAQARSHRAAVQQGHVALRRYRR